MPVNFDEFIIPKSAIVWLKNFPDNKYQCYVNFTKEGGFIANIISDNTITEVLIRRELMGNKNNLIGELDNGKKFTLINCFGLEYSISSNSSIDTYRVQFGYLITGYEIGNTEDEIFEELNLKLNINNWIEVSGFNDEEIFKNIINKDYKYCVNYKKPKNQLMFEDSKMILTMCYNSDIQTGGIQKIYNQVTIKQEVYFNIIFKSPLNFIEIKKIIPKLTSFFRLICNSNINIESVSGVTGNHNLNLLLPFKIYEIEFKHHYSLIKHSEISNTLGENLKKWFEIQNSQDLKPVLDLYFGTISSEEQSLNFCFLNYCKIIESYHRIRLDHEPYFKSEFKDLLKQINEAIKHSPEHLKEIVSNKLSHIELTFENRLEEYFKSFNIPTFHFFIQHHIKDIKNTRNYLTHLDKKTKKKTIDDEILERVNLMLKSSIETILLKEIGISDEKLKELWDGEITTVSYFNHLKNYGHI
jgi:ApeA N-terminal domain 1